MTQTELNLCFTLHRTRMALKAAQQLLARRGEAAPVPDLSDPVLMEYPMLEALYREQVLMCVQSEKVLRLEEVRQEWESTRAAEKLAQSWY